MVSRETSQRSTGPRRALWAALVAGALLATATAWAGPPAPRAPDAVFSARLRSGPGDRGEPQAYRVAFYGDAAGRRAFLTVSPATNPTARPYTSPFYPAFKLRVADLDGDGTDELVLGVWSMTRRHREPEPHRAVWVLTFTDGGLREAWRGSGLSHPLIDVEVAPLMGPRHDIIALEHERGRRRVRAYAWDGFGLNVVARSALLPATAVLAPDARDGARVLVSDQPHRMTRAAARLVLTPQPPDATAPAERSIE